MTNFLNENFLFSPKALTVQEQFQLMKLSDDSPALIGASNGKSGKGILETGKGFLETGKGILKNLKKEFLKPE